VGLALGHHLVGDLLAAGVAGVGGLLGQLVEALALEVDHLAQLVGDLVVDAPEVGLLEHLLAAPAQVLEHLPDALEALAVAVAEAALHHATQGRVQVAVVQQVVGDLRQHVVGAQLEAHLGAVPRRVAEGWLVPATPVPVDVERSLCGEGHVLEPSFDALVQAMKAAYENRGECGKRGASGRRIAETKLTWNHVARCVAARLDALSETSSAASQAGAAPAPAVNPAMSTKTPSR